MAALGAGWTVAFGVIGTGLLAFIAAAVAGGLKHDEALEAAHLSWLRFGHGKIIATCLGWLAVCFIVLAWVRAGRLAVAGLVSLRWLARTMACWVAPLLVAAPLFTRDVYSYLAQGALLRDGHDPYREGPVLNPGVYADNVAEVWSTTGAPYGPLFMLVMKLLTSLVGNHIVAGVILTRLIMLPGVILSFWSVVQLAKHFKTSPEAAVWLAMLNPLMIVNLIGGGHNEMLMVGLLSSGLTLALQGKQRGGVALIALAACVKATAVLALPFVGWIWLAQVMRQERERISGRPTLVLVAFGKVVGQTMAIAAAALGLCSLLAGVSLGWTKEIFDTVVVVNWLAVPTAVAQVINITIGALFDWNQQETLEMSREICTVALVAVLPVIWWWFREPVGAVPAAVDQDGGQSLVAKAERFLRAKLSQERAQVLGRRALIGAILAMVATIELSVAAFPWYFSWPLVLGAGLVTTQAGRAGVVFWSSALLFMFGLDGDQQMYSLPMMVFGGIVSSAAAAAFWPRREVRESSFATPVLPPVAGVALSPSADAVFS